MASVKRRKAFLKAIGESPDGQDNFNRVYLAMKIKLGMLSLEADPYPDPFTGKTGSEITAGQEDVSDTLLSFAGVALKYFGDGLYTLGERTFSLIRRKSEKAFMDYTNMITKWKTRVWTNARDMDGRKFDAYVVDVVPHAEMIKRIQAVESIHKALSNISAIYNAPVAKNDDSWTTPECEKAIKNMEAIGFKARHYDFLNTVSKQYASARKKQSMYLHGYDAKKILNILTRCEKLASYGDSKYIAEFEKTYLKYTDNLEDFEQTTASKLAESDHDEDSKSTKEIDDRDHEAKVRAARMWWLAHFLKAAYTVTSDILTDVEKLAVVVERCIGTRDDD